ncbi:ATPase [Pseudomonas fluorescens]|uniref:ATPase n=1 Tax=Pseudomonas fluorescens TaxID=294 RepID=UPI0017815958|nr:ATPase [Pseudomonas fluorescens]
MPDKSHVSLEQQVCIVCGVAFDTGTILIDKRLRPCLEQHTTTGWGLCAEHQRLFSENFVALIECDPQRSGNPSGRLKPEQAYRTGHVAHLKREVFATLFNVPIADDQACVFVEPGVIEQLQAMVEPSSS